MSILYSSSCHMLHVCGRNLITGLTSPASPRVDIPSSCKVEQKLGVSLRLFTCSPSAWPSRLLYRRGRNSRRDLRITLYIRASTYKKRAEDSYRVKTYLIPKHRFKDNIEVDMEEIDLKVHYRPIWFRMRFLASPATITAGITIFSVAREKVTGCIFCVSWLPRVKNRTGCNVRMT